MSNEAVFFWLGSILFLLGFGWAIGAPDCYGSTFYYPAFFGAVFLAGGLASADRGKRGRGLLDEPPTNPIELLAKAFLFGVVYIILSVPVVALGWFLGVVVCFNLLPKLGFFHCLACV